MENNNIGKTEPQSLQIILWLRGYSCRKELV